MYNEKVMKIFQNPEHMGDLKGANAIGQVGNMSCGDIMKIYLKINEKEIIEDATFKTFGCVAAIVSSSIACGLVIGKTIDEALNFDNNDVIKEVGDLPVHKVHCSVLAKEAIEDAIKNYRKAQEKANKKKTVKVEKTAVEEQFIKEEQTNKEVVEDESTQKTELVEETNIKEEKPKKLKNKKEVKKVNKGFSKLNSLLSKLDKK